MSRQRQALHQEQAREGAPEASLNRVDLAAEMVGLHEWAQRVKTLSAEGHRERFALAQAFPKAGRGGKSLLSCSVVARSTKETPGCLVGYPVLRPFLRGNALVRLLWIWTLLCAEEREHTARSLFEWEESLRELSMRCDKMDQHR